MLGLSLQATCRKYPSRSGPGLEEFNPGIVIATYNFGQISANLPNSAKVDCHVCILSTSIFVNFIDIIKLIDVGFST